MLLYFVGIVSYIIAVGLIIFGIALFFAPNQLAQNPYSSSNDAILFALIYGSGISFIFSGVGVLISGALMVAFADLVRSNIHSEEHLIIMAEVLERRRRRRE